MRASMKVAKLDFFTMKSQLFSYLSLAAAVLMFGFMGSSVTVLCITGAWFVALQASSIFAIQEKNNLDHLYGSVSVGLNDIVLGRYIFMYVNYLITFLAVIALYFGFAFYRNAAISIQDIMFGFSLSFLVFSAITGIQMPLYFKMGYTKAKMWSLIPFVAVMAFVLIPSFVSALSGIVKSLLSHTIVLTLGGIAAGSMIQFISYRIAVVLYLKRK